VVPSVEPRGGLRCGKRDRGLLSTFRAKKPPTRRHIAAAVSESIRVLNGQAANQDWLKAQIEAHTTQLTVLARPFWGRVRWLVFGR
jgi:hypothetical protein